jgi:hypothetical protein
MPKLDAPGERLLPRPKAESAALAPATAAGTRGSPDAGPEQRLSEALTAAGFQVEAVTLEPREVAVYVSQDTYRHPPRAVGRVARIVANRVPASVERITVVNLESGLETGRTRVWRHDLENADQYQGSAEEVWSNAELGRGDGRPEPGSYLSPQRYPSFDWSISPQLRQHVGGPDNFYFWQIWARLLGQVDLTRNLSVTGALGLDIANNLEGLELESNSQLPHVRSDIARYLKEGKNGIPRLEVDYLWQPAPEWYARASLGLLEEMYGGASGEVLYRPYNRRWALGADLNWVRQRDYDMLFDFLDYDVVTGHGTLYYDLPYFDLTAKVMAGRYLAGDVGVTLDMSRRFGNGITMGAFATFTDVSAEEFGEGSFDKGLYISIPLDLFFVRSRRGSAGFLWRPLTRDGGQTVAVGKRLYPLTADGTLGAMGRDWNRLLD